jgi:hypothetical protein
MPFQNNVPFPLYDAIVEANRSLSRPWLDWFTQQQQINEAAAIRVNSVSLSTQGASIGATDFSGGTLDAGTYRISYYARITRAATVNSSLTIDFDWVDGGVTQTFTGAAMVGNTTTTHQELSFPIVIDQLTAVRYTTTYASAGATSMQYKLYIALEEIEG